MEDKAQVVLEIMKGFLQVREVRMLQQCIPGLGYTLAVDEGDKRQS